MAVFSNMPVSFDFAAEIYSGCRILGMGGIRMRYLLNADQMKACDQATIEKFKVPSLVLMERAALAVRDAVLEHYPDARRILVICGSGNNGGDGYAAARLLNLAGRTADVLFVGKHDHRTEQTALQAEIFLRYGGRELPDDTSLKGYDLILDALFGIGLKREVIGRYADVIGAVNRVDTPVLAIDIPSGVSADTGLIMGCAVQAEMTVTMQHEKLGQMLFPGAYCCGKVLTADVGITDDGADWESEPVYALEKSDLKDLLPKRRPDANKGTYGKLLLIAGAKDMAGAAILAAKAALAGGCGLVRVLSDEANRVILQTAVPEALFAPWPENGDIRAYLEWADAVAIGPGLGQSAQSRDLLSTVLSFWSGSSVIDADALNLMAGDPSLLPDHPLNAVLTPHPGEMSRLSVLIEEGGFSVPQIVSDPVTAALSLSENLGCVSVMKGARTVIADNGQVWLNTYGNEGMASGGSGDVLTGIIGSLLAQGTELSDAAKAGVLVHALAGDAASKDTGTRSMKAGDLIDHLPEVLNDF